MDSKRIRVLDVVCSEFDRSSGLWVSLSEIGPHLHVGIGTCREAAVKSLRQAHQRIDSSDRARTVHLFRYYDPTGTRVVPQIASFMIRRFLGLENEPQWEKSINASEIGTQVVLVKAHLSELRKCLATQVDAGEVPPDQAKRVVAQWKGVLDTLMKCAEANETGGNGGRRTRAEDHPVYGRREP